MPSLHWGLLCQEVITDQETNAVSYIKGVEEFTIPGFPAQLPQITVSTIWWKEEDNDTIDMRIRISPPNDENEEVFEVSHDFGGSQRFRVNRGLKGFPVTEPGLLEIYIEHRSEEGWDTCQRIPVVIKHEPQDFSNN
jgi:hypothetical protein